MKRMLPSTVVTRIGLLLLAAALLLTGYNFWTDYSAKLSAEEILHEMEQLELPVVQEPEQEQERPGDNPVQEMKPPEPPAYLLDPTMEMPVVTLKGIDYIGTLAIPDLDLELPIISSWSDWELKVAPSRYSGSAYTGDMVIAGHNYRSHFGSLGKLKLGAAVHFIDMDGNVFDYQVTDLEVLAPTAIQEMVSGEEELTLFTCTMDGKARFTIRCTQVWE